jgi:hypothetical protein
MALRRREVEVLTADYPSLKVLALTSSLPLASVAAVSVSVCGIQGMNSTLRYRYDLIIETTSLAATIPPVWVRHPRDADIKHVNIYRAGKSFCRWAGTDLPSFCWDEFGDGWRNSAPNWRTLGSALEYIKQFLNTENHDSAAR